MSEGVLDVLRFGAETPRRGRRFLQAALFRTIPTPGWVTPNEVVRESPIHRLRRFHLGAGEAAPGAGAALPVLVVPPEVNRSTIVDFHPEQSLVATIIRAGLPEVAVLEWRSATAETARRDIDESVRTILESLAHLGDRVHLIGICQGGWESAIAAALAPEQVASLTLVAAPIDFTAGEGMVKHLTQATPILGYHTLVTSSGGVMPGRLISLGFDGLMAFQRFWLKYLTLWNHLDDEAWLARHHRIDDWYRSHKDLPGPLYLRAVRELFKENRLVQGRFICLGRKVDLARVTCPLCLVAGRKDHITPAQQVWAARAAMRPCDVLQVTTPGGHIGAFMGRTELREHWPGILRWLRAAER